jgi:hypothetical protein
MARLNRKYGVGPSPATPSSVGTTKDKFSQLLESRRKMQQDKAMPDTAMRMQGAPGVTMSTQVTPSQNHNNNTFTLPYRPMQRPVTTEPQENNNTNTITLPFRPK